MFEKSHSSVSFISDYSWTKEKKDKNGRGVMPVLFEKWRRFLNCFSFTEILLRVFGDELPGYTVIIIFFVISN